MASRPRYLKQWWHVPEHSQACYEARWERGKNEACGSGKARDLEESDVKERGVVVCKLEDKIFYDEGPFIGVIVPVKLPISEFDRSRLVNLKGAAVAVATGLPTLS